VGQLRPLGDAVVHIVNISDGATELLWGLDQGRTAMPHFFHVHDGTFLPDHQGVELPGLKDAGMDLLAGTP
jgi:hypothetical protein